MSRVSLIVKNHISDAAYLQKVNPELSAIHLMMAEVLLAKFDLQDQITDEQLLTVYDEVDQMIEQIEIKNI